MAHKATTIKNVIIAQNALKGLSKDEQDEVYSVLYGDNNALRYIKAVHQQDGNEYLWYIHADSNIAYIAEGVYLRVEQLNGTKKREVY